VEDNLDAFKKPRKKSSKHSRKLKDSNIYVPTSGSEEDSDVAIDFDYMVGCAGCGMRNHDVSDCNNRSRGNQRYN
jgi:hypothetical protein